MRRWLLTFGIILASGFICGPVSALCDVPYKTLFLEHFSSNTCNSCPLWSEQLRQVCLNLHANDSSGESNFVVANYQVNIPITGDSMVTDQTDAYRLYYDCYSAPAFYMNGKFFWPASVAKFNGQTADSIAAFRTREVSLALDARLLRDSNRFRVEAQVSTYTAEPDSFMLMVNFVEDYIHLDSHTVNGEQDFYDIVRLMLPSLDGFRFLPEAEGGAVSYTVDASFDLDGTPRVFSGPEHLRVVVFLRNIRTGEVIQARYLYPSDTILASEPELDTVSNRAVYRVESALKLYPNPARSSVWLEYTPSHAQDATVRVMDLAGRELMSARWAAVAGTNRMELDVSALKSGTYLVSVGGSRSLAVSKLIVK